MANKALKIAFSGKMRSGKDTAAEYFRGKHTRRGWTVSHASFAAKLKQVAAMIQRELGFPEEKDRELLQWLGAEYGRARDPEVWVKCLLKEVERQESIGTDLILVTDMRFENEFDALKKAGFVLVRVEASEETRLGRGAEPTKLAHISETALDARCAADFEGFDYLVYNDGTYEEFTAKLDYVYDSILTSEITLASL